ncbi:MAG: hypothetical protein MJE66_21350 [Proteobacteria bacterium]|nr:hypothetical protein [Pseudomonadota bacterium]
MAKIKGISLLELVTELRKRRDEALQTLPESVHHYLDQEPQVSQWYPEEDHIQLLRGYARLLEQDGHKNVYEMAGVVHARNHVEGVYEHLLAGSDASTLSLRLAALWGSMHDTGRVRVKTLGPGEVQAEVVDYGHPTPEMCAMVGAYFKEAYRLSGAANVRIAKSACRVDDDDQCTWEIAWDAGED